MKHKSLTSLTALLIAGLLLLSSCDKTPSEVSEGGMPQSEAVSEAAVSDIKSDVNSEYTSSVEEESTPESSAIEESSEEPSAEVSEPSEEESSEEPSEQPSEQSSEELAERKAELEKYRRKYNIRFDDKENTEAFIIHGYMGSEYGVADANCKVLYRCIYDSAHYYGFESPDIIILSDWEMKETHVLDAWGKEIEFKGDGEYTRFSYLNGAILAYDEKTELYTLFRVDGTPYENIPSFKTDQRFPTKNLAITYTENGVEKGAYLRATGRRSFELVPYGKAEKQAAEDKYRKKIIDVFNSFTDALRSGDKQEMLKYATEDLVYHAVTGCDDEKRHKDPKGLKDGFLAFDVPESIENQRIKPDYPVFFYIDDSKGGISECFFIMQIYLKEQGYKEPFMAELVGITVICDGNGNFKLDTINTWAEENWNLAYDQAAIAREKEKENKK